MYTIYMMSKTCLDGYLRNQLFQLAFEQKLHYKISTARIRMLNFTHKPNVTVSVVEILNFNRRYLGFNGLPRTLTNLKFIQSW